jgi:nitrogen regulatory protein P-II 1
MKKIEAIVRPAKLEALKEAFLKADIKGMTISEVHGCGNQHGWKEFYRGSEIIVNTLPKIKFEVVVADNKVQSTVDLIVETAKTGEVGDGKIFILPVEEVVRIRTSESGEVAI